MKHIKLVLGICCVLVVSGCATSGHLIRDDRQPGQGVDETVLGFPTPLCLRSDPKALRLTNDSAGDGLRQVVWTRHDGTKRSGTWYIHKKSNVLDPQPKDVYVRLAWSTDNLFSKFAGDERTPSRIMKLSEFKPC